MNDPVLWFTVPNGCQGTDLKLSIVASPINVSGADVMNSVWDNWTDAVYDGQSLRLKFFPEFTADLTSVANPNPPEGTVALPQEYLPFAGIWKMLFPQPGPLTMTGKRSFAVPVTTHSASQLADFALRSLDNDYRRALRRLVAKAEPASGKVTISASSNSSEDDLQSYLASNPDTDLLGSLRWLRWQEPKANNGARIASACVVVTEFKKWIASQLQVQGQGTSAKIAEARRAERNAYRLASNPWVDLQDDALAVAWYLALDDPSSQDCPSKLVDELRRRDTDRWEALRLAVFYGRVRNEEKQVPENPHLAEKIAMLNNYPQLMRKVGLVFDLLIPQVLLRSDYVGVRLRVALNNQTFGSSPWTRIKENSLPCEFYAVTTDDTYVDGMINPAHLTVQSLEADALLLKMISHASSPASEVSPTAESEAMATPSANGIAVHLEDRATRIGVQLQRVQDLQQQFATAAALTASVTGSTAQVGPFGFESLVRGYVPFVAEGNGSFRSLCKRNERYEFFQDETGKVAKSWPEPDGNPQAKMPMLESKDGFIAAGATTTYDATSKAATDPDSKDLHVHNAIVSWTGWSLSVPKRLQQLKIDPSDPVDDSCKPDPKSGPMMCAQFEVEKRTLTRLRFGRAYKFRIGCIDVAGNVRDSNASSVDPCEHHFLRYDPVPPPEIILTQHLSLPDSPGEQLTQMVIRTNEEEDQRCVRAVVPPRCSFALAELCGMFDDRSPFKTKSFDQIALQKNGGLPVDPEGPGAVPATADCRSAVAGRGNPIYVKPGGKFQPCQYLPDPFASGFSIGITDLSNGRPVRFDIRKGRGSTENESSVIFMNLSFYRKSRSWPSAAMWLLITERQKSHTREVSAYVDERTFHGAGLRRFQALVVRVPEGKEVAIALHSWIKAENLSKMAVFSRVAAGVLEIARTRSSKSQTVVSPREIVARLGNFPATTTAPARNLTVVHAISRPLLPPKFHVLSPRGRQLSETFQAFDDVQIDIERASTGNVNLVASWQEWLDRDESGPIEVSKTEVPVCETTIAPPQLLQKATELHTSSSSGKNQVCTEEPLSELPLEHLWRTRLHGTYKPVSSEPGKIRQDFGDTKHRVVNYNLIASTRFAEYFNSPATVQRAPSTFKVSVLNAAVPPVPSVAYVAPLFDWKKPELEARAVEHERRVYKSERKGGGCRLWLNRPWYMTGDEEQLGLVVWNDAEATNGLKDTEHLVTRWGADPIWEEESATRGPGPSSVESEMLGGSAASLPVEGLKSGPIVLPLSPKFDDGNRLWYVDVRFSDVPSYFSFIRFALVRYQKHSIEGCSFSPVTLAQFVQLTPDRAVSIMRVVELGKESANKLDVVMTGDLANTGNCYSVQVQELWDSGGSRKWWIEKTAELFNYDAPNGNSLARWRVKFDDNLCRPKRLIVREYEQFEEDDQVGGDRVSTVSQTLCKRLVFADVLEI